MSTDWLDEVRRILDHVRTSDAVEVEIEAPEFRLRLVRRPDVSTQVTPSIQAGAGANRLDDLAAIVAPLTGVFYRSPSPSTPAYVEVGDRIEADTVVGLIETMKIFNEIVAERAGQIAAIVADTGQLVHAGETLMSIENLAEPGAGQSDEQGPS